MDTAIIHNFDRGLWDELKSPAYAGAISELKSSSRTFEYSDPSITHNVDIRDYIVQEITYKAIAELKAIAAFLNHPTVNVHRRGSRPRVCRPMPILYDDINVVHPSFTSTFISLLYNYTTLDLRVRVSYAKVPSQTSDGAASFSLSSAPPPEKPPKRRRSTLDSLTDEQLVGQVVDVADGCYEVTNDPVWSLALVEGQGPVLILESRDKIQSRVLLTIL